jgi:hypothetical protein
LATPLEIGGNARCKRRWPWLLLVALVGVALAVYFEPSHCVRGWLWGEAFFDGRPTSFWADEIQQWECVYQDSGNFKLNMDYKRRRVRWPKVVERFLREPTTLWPRLLDGDAEGMPVLDELRQHSSAEVRDWARIGIERIDNRERGPRKTIVGPMDLPGQKD